MTLQSQPVFLRRDAWDTDKMRQLKAKRMESFLDRETGSMASIKMGKIIMTRSMETSITRKEIQYAFYWSQISVARGRTLTLTVFIQCDCKSHTRGTLQRKSRGNMTIAAQAVAAIDVASAMVRCRLMAASPRSSSSADTLAVTTVSTNSRSPA